MMPSDRGRWMAIDWGERRIGLAISDPSGIIATPAGVITRRAGKRPPVAELVRQSVALEATMDGTAGELAVHATPHHFDDIVERQLQRRS